MPHSVKFIPVYQPLLDGKEAEYVLDCINTGWVSSLGKYTTKFEDLFARFCGTRNGVAVFNGTVALHLALLALGIGADDEVIVPSLTFVATANAVRYTGARVVFADCEAETWTIDINDIRRRITPHTRAIIPVHLYGHPADMKALMALAREKQLWVIEDAAEAHGAMAYGQRVGSFGDINSFSFYGNKIITTGEGGMLTTNDPHLAERMKFLRDQAMSTEKRYWHPEIGYNYRMTNIQAALGVAQMERIEEFLQRKITLAAKYNERFSQISGITTPPKADWAEPVYWMYSILLNQDFPLSRDEAMQKLKEAGIDSRPFFYPIHTMPPYENHQSLPVSEDLSKRGINLPSFVSLTSEDITRVTDAFRRMAG
jgi:perosamine synthetase